MPQSKEVSKVKIRQIRGNSGRTKEQIATLKGLGLGRMHRIVELENTPAVKGMVDKVRHMLEILTTE
ncbi:50S ribosomal subunit protein L30 [Alphaproteobacteria bacterium]